MADNVTLPGTGGVVATDQIADSSHVQFIKIMDGTLNGETKAAVGANGLSVDVKASALPSGASTAAKQPALGTAGTASADVISVQGIASMTPLQVGGSVAVNAISSGNPGFCGGIAVVAANPTKATNGQRTGVATDAIGRVIVTQNHERTMVGVQQTTITSSTSETTIVTAVASTFLDLTHLSITNSSATATLVTLKDATSGTTRGIWSIAAGGGIVLSFNTPLAQATVNNNWTLTCGSSISSLYVVAQFVKNT